MKKKIMSMAILILIAALAVIFALPACSRNDVPVDFSSAKNWASLPGDPSHPVDVFYLYPTTYVMGRGEDHIALINNQTMRIGADAHVLSQASVFAESANIYAPYYRQLDGDYCLSLPIGEQIEEVSGIPLTDATDAFVYYLENYNNGKPFFLAGHSQGSMVLLGLLADYFADNPGVMERMIAAYAIGYSVTGSYLEQNPHLAFAEGADDTGVIISYNTEAPEVDGNNPVLWPGAIAINPISWTRGDTSAPKEESLGAVIFDLDAESSLEHPQFADAAVNLERGSVICSTVDPDQYSSSNEAFGKGVYHSYDYQFYYMDLRKNIQDRLDSYTAGQH